MKSITLHYRAPHDGEMHAATFESGSLLHDFSATKKHADRVALSQVELVEAVADDGEEWRLYPVEMVAVFLKAARLQLTAFTPDNNGRDDDDV